MKNELATLSMDGFDQYSESLLKSIVNSSKDLKITDIHNNDQLKKVKESRIVLKNKRVEITKFAKNLRDASNQFSKDVIAKEKDLVSILSDEEERLKNEEERVKVELELEKRKEQLPERKAKLKSIGSNTATDEQIIGMQDDAFLRFFDSENARIQQEKIDAEKKKQEEEAEKLRKEREALEEEKMKIAREKELEEAKQKAANEAKEKAEQDAKDAIRKAEQEAAQKIKDLEDKARREKEEREQKEKEEKEALKRIEEEKKAEAEKLAKRKKYNDFLEKNGYKDGDGFKILKSGDGKQVMLYKLVDTFTI